MFRTFADAPLSGEETVAIPAPVTAVVELHFERAFTIAEVAEKIGISPRQVQAHVDDGNLIAVNVGRGKERKDLRVLDEDLEGFLRRRKTGVNASAVEPRRSKTTPNLKAAPVSYAARRAERLLSKRR